MLIHFLKAAHIIGFVVWFAGLFYLVRLFVYHAEAAQKPKEEHKVLHKQYVLMERRLYYIITWPGLVLTIVFGLWMLHENPGFLTTWLFLKLVFVALLVGYHLICGKLLHDFKHSRNTWSSLQLRLWNEAATLLLVAIVFIAVFQNLIDFAYGAGGLLLVGGLLYGGIKAYRYFRKA